MPYSRIAISISSADLEQLRQLVSPQGKSISEYIAQLVSDNLLISEAPLSLQVLVPVVEDMSHFGAVCRKMGLN